MRQQTLPLGVLAPDDVFICFDIGAVDLEAEFRTLQRAQPAAARQAPVGRWLVKSRCFECAISAAYCRRHEVY